MKNLTRLALKYPVTVAMAALAVGLLAFLAMRGMPVSLLPEVRQGVLTLSTPWPGAPAKAVETSITRPLEEVLSGTPGLENMECLSLDGLSRCTLEFALGIPVDTAAQAVGDRLDRLRNALPQDAGRTVVNRFDPTDRPVMRCFVTATGLGEKALGPYVAENWVRDLERTEGVAAVDLLGGLEPEVRVSLSLPAIKAHHLTPMEIVERVKEGAQVVPAGEWVQGGRSLPVKTGRVYDSLESIRNIPVGNPGEVVFPLFRVASVGEDNLEPKSMALRNGKPGIFVDIRRAPGVDTSALCGRLRASVAAVNQREKGRLVVSTLRDESKNIGATLRHLLLDGIAGGLAALVVLTLLMRHRFLPIGLSLVLPFSFALALTALYLGGVRLHALTLTGFAVAVGLMLDNAIITLDAMMEKRRQGKTWAQAALLGPQSTALSVVASSGSTLIVFVPLLFVKGLLGAFFADMALAVMAAVASSVVVCLVLLPVVVAHPAVAKILGATGEGRVFGFMARLWGRTENFYGRSLAGVLARRRTLLVAVPILLLAGTAALAFTLDRSLVPQVPTRHLALRFEMPGGTPLATTHRHATSLADDWRHLPGVKGLSLLSGAEGEPWVGTWDRQGPHGASFLIETKNPSWARRVLGQIKSWPLPAGGHVEGGFEGDASVSWLGGPGASVWELHHSDESQFGRGVRLCQGAFQKLLPGARVTSDFDRTRESVQVQMNPRALAQSVLDPGEVSANLRTLVSGTPAGEMVRQGATRPIRVVLEDGQKNQQDLGDFPAMSRGRPPMSLQAVGELAPVRERPVLRRQNHSSYVVIEVTGAPVSSIESAIPKIEKSLGAGYHLTRGPAAARQSKALGELILAFAMAVAFIYLFLGAQMGSFTGPLPVLASIPPVFIGAAGALLAGGHGLTLFSGLGLLLLAGAIVREGVLLTERYRELPPGGHDPQAFISCTLSRLRPVTATALAAILALLPLALGLGEGTEIQAPLALAMVGGLFTGTLMTLYFLPALLYRPRDGAKVTTPGMSGIPDAGERTAHEDTGAGRTPAGEIGGGS